jgi:hypothetical protein
MGLQVHSENKITVLSVEEPIIPASEDGQTSSFQSEVHAACCSSVMELFITNS